MDLRQLRYFVAVAEELHFGRAAARVGIAQPPLTQQIQKLEASIGCQLFARGRKTALTAAGTVLLDEARRILRQTDEAVEATLSAARGESGQLRVGAPPSVMLSALPSLIRQYRKQYPGVRFSLREMSTSAIEKALRVGEIDVGFLREISPEPPLASETIFEEPVVAALPASHPMTSAAELKLGDLRAEPFVFFPRGLGATFYDKLISFCAEAGFTPNVVQEATQWQSIVCLVEAGMGISVAPGCVTRFRWSGVVYRPLRGLKTRVTVSWRPDAPSLTAAVFVNLTRLGFRDPAAKQTNRS
jgi:DNA-binding transcriptional LysR family regulator